MSFPERVSELYKIKKRLATHPPKTPQRARAVLARITRLYDEAIAELNGAVFPDEKTLTELERKAAERPRRRERQP